MPKVGLCMIVRNEARIIQRCLRSVRRLVDYVSIEDTGSTDGTQDIIRAWLAAENMPGEVFEEPWQDFATNRTLSLERLRRRPDIDYALIMDADDYAVVHADFDEQRFRAALTQDLYSVEIHHNAVRHWRPQMLSNHKAFRYRGKLHEFIEGPDGHSSGTLADFHVVAGVEGHRSENPDKYRDDATLLERALADERDPFMISRYTFYLAQSWKDAGEPARALDAYLRRATQGFWAEEVFISLLHAARLKEKLEYPDTDVIGSFLAAYEVCPHRAEALYEVMRHCRAKNKFHQGYLVGRQAVAMRQPQGLFIDTWVYEYGLFDEFSILAFWVGQYEECVVYGEKALASPALPAAYRGRINTNVQLARQRLNLPPPPAAPIAGLHPGRATVVSLVSGEHAHTAAFAEVAETVLYGLRGAGYDAGSTSSLADATGQVVVVGAHLLPPHQALPRDAIIYNTEHIAWITETGGRYLDLLMDHEVWDYSADNARRLTGYLGRQVHHLKLGYAPSLTRLAPAPEQDIDVLFYGAVNPRRDAILQGLRAEGLNVTSVFGVYGEERDALIARAKVVLSMHYYLPGVFEMVRVSYLLANRKAVVAEVNPGEAIDEDLAGGVLAVPYEQLVAACCRLVRHARERHALERTGFRLFSRRDIVDEIRQQLGARLPATNRALLARV